MPEEEVRTITVKKKEAGKLKRWVVNPVKRLASWEPKDSKKERVSA